MRIGLPEQAPGSAEQMDLFFTGFDRFLSVLNKFIFIGFGFGSQIALFTTGSDYHCLGNLGIIDHPGYKADNTPERDIRIQYSRPVARAWLEAPQSAYPIPAYSLN